ncbi:DUF4312 family protein [Paenibacillus sp. P96]|uniref:DUF4312 family protein n=1 Tax=Paenibacillus zeirhizosphaerae TaxID=2987519 RepID=A0ABT9FUD7_9BACL|nr:DUF4312 family protein [Paenibacillus sp. P96]MDP4098348.1 DUF4312 family protein [Paenibacillus sp. P96]
MYLEKEITLTITGSGESERAAFQHILNEMKKQVTANDADMMLQIEPRNMEVLSAAKTVRTEKFLGILFPRTRTRYEVKAKITVMLRYMDLSKIEYEVHEEKQTAIQHVIRMR